MLFWDVTNSGFNFQLGVLASNITYAFVSFIMITSIASSAKIIRLPFTLHSNQTPEGTGSGSGIVSESQSENQIIRQT